VSSEQACYHCGRQQKISIQALMQLRDKQRIAILSAYALALHGFESLLPMPIPWLKLVSPTL
jgi:hypothetical protein